MLQSSLPYRGHPPCYTAAGRAAYHTGATHPCYTAGQRVTGSYTNLCSALIICLISTQVLNNGSQSGGGKSIVSPRETWQWSAWRWQPAFHHAGMSRQLCRCRTSRMVSGHGWRTRIDRLLATGHIIRLINMGHLSGIMSDNRDWSCSVHPEKGIGHVRLDTYIYSDKHVGLHMW